MLTKKTIVMPDAASLWIESGATTGFCGNTVYVPYDHMPLLEEFIPPLSLNIGALLEEELSLSFPSTD